MIKTLLTRGSEMTARSILEKAAQHMQDRAATYDKPEGERSMCATVQAFNVITGHAMAEEQGWLFMALLKAVRSQQGAYRADSYEDGAAYFALMGEAAVQERNGGWTDEEIGAAAFKHTPSEAEALADEYAHDLDEAQKIFRRRQEANRPDWAEW